MKTQTSFLPEDEKIDKTKTEEKRAIQAGKIRKEGKRLRKSLRQEYRIEDRGGLEILDRAIESFCRMKEAEAIIAAEGLTVLNRWDEKKEHPALNTERKARGQFLLCLKQLGLDLDPLGK